MEVPGCQLMGGLANKRTFSHSRQCFHVGICALSACLKSRLNELKDIDLIEQCHLSSQTILLADDPLSKSLDIFTDTF